MIEERFIKLKEDGTLEFVKMITEPRNINQAIIDRLGGKQIRYLKRAFTVGERQCGLVLSLNECHVFAFMESITINTAYKLWPDKLLRPVFLGSRETSLEHPIIPAVWPIPLSMKLIFAAKVENFNSDTPKATTCYLMAVDTQKRFWRLPLPNLYDDLKMCMGQFDGVAHNAQQCFSLALSQMDQAQWNADLLDIDREAGSQHMFRFNPTETGVDPVPFEGDWTIHCKKVSTAITELIGGAL